LYIDPGRAGIFVWQKTRVPLSNPAVRLSDHMTISHGGHQTRIAEEIANYVTTVYHTTSRSGNVGRFVHHLQVVDGLFCLVLLFEAFLSKNVIKINSRLVL